MTESAEAVSHTRTSATADPHRSIMQPEASQFTILTIGWEPEFIDVLLAPIERLTGIRFVHGLVGDASRVSAAGAAYPHLRFVPVSKARHEPLPRPDLEMLARLEARGIPTIRSMIQGDRVLRFRPEADQLGYATLLAVRIKEAIRQVNPDAVLASYDGIHSGVSLALAKQLGVPWTAMAFPVIPDNLTGFCCALTPDSVLPLGRGIDDEMRATARALIANVRSRQQKVVAFRAPATLGQWVVQYVAHGRNFLRRRNLSHLLGIDGFLYPTARERIGDVVRRSINRIRLPAGHMLRAPPESRFAYYPFHMAPESMVDTWAPFYQNQLAFVAQISQAMPADVVFVVKLHFSDPDNYSRTQLKQLLRLPKLKIAHPDAPGSEFLAQSSLIVGIQGTSCLEGALLGKPVLVFGDSPYQHFPRSERALRPDELHQQISRMLATPPPADDEVVEAFARYMARYMPGRINDWSRPIEPEEMKRLADCFNAMRGYVDQSHHRVNWYKRAPFEAAPAAECESQSSARSIA